jgi:MarR family transcriptional regulator, organic hydroperoxide resistance regulator
MATTSTRTARNDACADLPDVLQFMQLLWAVVHGLEKTSKRMAGDLGVTGPQRLALRVVGIFPGVSAGDLAAILRVHPSTLTGVLQRLAAQRWLLRVDDPGDRRRATLRLTARGARVNAARRGTVESAVADTLKSVTARDRAATKRVMERLTHHLETPAAGEQTPKSSRKPDRAERKKGV